MGVSFAVKIGRFCLSGVKKCFRQIQNLYASAFEKFVKIRVVFYEIRWHLWWDRISSHQLVRVNGRFGRNWHKEKVYARFVQLGLEI